MRKVTKDKVIEIINLSFNDRAKITAEQNNENLQELGMDSITFIRIAVAIEEEFECEIPDEKLLITEMDTVQKILDVLQSIYDNQG